MGFQLPNECLKECLKIETAQFGMCCFQKHGLAITLTEAVITSITGMRLPWKNFKIRVGKFGLKS